VRWWLVGREKVARRQREGSWKDGIEKVAEYGVKEHL